MTPELRSPLAVACHDAGACNVILPWLRRPDLSLRPVLAGPAARLFAGFARPGGGMAAGAATWLDGAAARDGVSDDALHRALDGAAMLLSGTGWASDLEHRARRLARARGVFSAAVIDHWVNYPMRFERGGEVVWPDEFWVTDDDAMAIARRCFAGAVVRCFDNLYLRGEVTAVAPLPALLPGDASAAAAQVLYVLEPMRSDWGRGVPGEFQALDHFLRHRAGIGVPPAAPIRLRPHPSDPPGKYDAWLTQRQAQDPALDIGLDRHASLAGAIGAATWVVGCESFALVVALAAGRRVCSSLPPWAPPCRLPHAGIARLAGPASAALPTRAGPVAAEGLAHT